jgi:hypothetical protein
MVPLHLPRLCIHPHPQTTSYWSLKEPRPYDLHRLFASAEALGRSSQPVVAGLPPRLRFPAAAWRGSLQASTTVPLPTNHAVVYEYTAHCLGPNHRDRSVANHGTPPEWPKDFQLMRPDQTAADRYAGFGDLIHCYAY